MGFRKIFDSFFVIFFFFLSFSFSFAAVFEVHFINVGYGDAILLKFPEKGTMLIDGGPEEYKDKVVEYIKSKNVKILNVVVITHSHSDHIGGIPNVLENIKVENIWVNQDISANSQYLSVYKIIQKKNISWQIVKRGRCWEDFKGVKIECLHPANITSNPNNNSIVLKITYKKVIFLFPGDITLDVERELLGIYKNHLKSNILKIPHHGQYSGCDFIKAIKPKIAVLTVGPNPYNAPDPETLKAYKEIEASILRTDELGTIVIKTDGKKIWWKSYGR